MGMTHDFVLMFLVLMIIVIIISFAMGINIFPNLVFVPDQYQGIQQEPEEIMVDPFVGFDWTPVWVTPILIIVGIYLLSGIKIIRPTDRGAIETLGKFTGFRDSGITYIFTFFQKLYKVNITETLIDVSKQVVITGDNLNTMIDAQVYYKVGETEQELKNALYKVRNYEQQIVQLAQTTLRNVIGQETFKEVNSNRAKLNKLIFESIAKETKDWGINIVRVELKEINPPENVQETMNKIILALNEKISAIDYATATETKAKGEKLAQIQRAIAIQQAQKLEADGEAEAIKKVADARKYEILAIARADADKIKMIAEADANRIKVVNESANKYFIENAKDLRTIEMTETSLRNNSKIILTEKGVVPSLIISDSGDKIVPFKADRREKKTESKDSSTDYDPHKPMT